MSKTELCTRREALWMSSSAAGLTAICVPGTTLGAQDEKGKPAAPVPAKPEDVRSIDAIVAAVYGAISGPPGPRDWTACAACSMPAPRLIPCRPRRRRGKGHDVDASLHRRRVHQSDRAQSQGRGFLRAGNRAPRRALRLGRARVQHIRIAPRRGRSSTIRAWDQQYSSSSSTASGGGSSPSSGTASGPASRFRPNTCRSTNDNQLASTSVSSRVAGARPGRSAPTRRRRCCHPCRSRRRADG